MMKYFNLTLLVVVCAGSMIKVPQNVSKEEISDALRLKVQWDQHIMDFLKLIDVEKVLYAALEHIGDPEVLKFLGFVLSPEFKEIIWEIETMAEFKEASTFLESKGYDVSTVLDIINSVLNLPPFEMANENLKKTDGINGLIEGVIEALPIEEIKTLFEHKVEHDPDIAELVETLGSEEFIDIVKRLAQNPKFESIKATFESYGFDFKYLCSMAQKIFGKYYQGIFCKETK